MSAPEPAHPISASAATLPAEAGLSPETQTTAETDDEPEEGLWTSLLEVIDTVVYVLVGVCFSVAAVFSLAYAVYSFIKNAMTSLATGHGLSLDALFGTGAAGQAIITLVSDLLLTLIIMEVLGTVVHHLRDKETTLKPFLFIGIISATRGILAVGARLSVSSDSHITEAFVADMIELGVNAVVIIALGVAMKLIGNFLDERTTPRNGRRRKRGRQARQRADKPAPKGAVAPAAIVTATAAQAEG